MCKSNEYSYVTDKTTIEHTVFNNHMLITVKNFKSQIYTSIAEKVSGTVITNFLPELKVIIIVPSMKYTDYSVITKYIHNYYCSFFKRQS